MADTDAEVLSLFEQTGALLSGHFILRSGLRSPRFFQCARVCEDLAAVERLATLLLARLSGIRFRSVLAPAMGGLVIGQEVARQAGVRYRFAEKEEGRLVLRRGFKLQPGEEVLIVEDVITRGGRVDECAALIKQAGGTVAGVAVLVDRSGGQARFAFPLLPLLEMNFPTYPPDQLPPELAAIPAVKPGS
ncbi:MAG: orotate phosphoribosyltransferase [Puniceicoccaceae bacterium]|nr:MAG: orotate phosphoribosyltransferase [Puniceicoccaceae bacterium]